MIKKSLYLLLILTILASLFSCGEDQPVEPQEPIIKERGEIISVSKISSYSPEFITLILGYAELDIPIEPEMTVDAYKVVYQTIDYHGEKVHASGALFIPATIESKPIVSFQHGTVTKRNAVASVDPFETPEGLTGIIMASTGYVAAVPDYLGFGTSQIIHPYVHADGNSHVVIDYLRAVRNYCETNNISLNDQLFLAGYSEGGYITMAVHREMEDTYSNEFTPTAVAPMAGPYDLNYTMDYILNKQEYSWPAYIGFFIVAYDEVYQWDRINDFFDSAYADKMVNYYSGGYSFWDINSQLPNNIESLLHTDFLYNYKNDNETEFSAAISDNSLLNWAPSAPVRLFHGDADNTVPYQNSVIAVENLTNAGAADISLHTVSGGTHETAGLPAIMAAIEWLDGFREQ